MRKGRLLHIDTALPADSKHPLRVCGLATGNGSAVGLLGSLLVQADIFGKSMVRFTRLLALVDMYDHSRDERHRSPKLPLDLLRHAMPLDGSQADAVHPEIDGPGGEPGCSQIACRRNSCALTATITVLNDMSTAPTAGESRMPCRAITPAASGIAITL